MKKFILLLAVMSISLHISADIISEARLMGIPQKTYDRYIRPYRKKKSITARLYASFHRGSYREIGRSQARFFLKHNHQFKAKHMKMIESSIPGNHPLRKFPSAR